MNNDKKAILYTLIDSVTYSLVPVLAALTINSLDGIPFLSLALLLSVISYFVYFKKIGCMNDLIFFKKYINYSLVGGIGFALSHLLLIYSINNSNNMYLPSIIFQIYPLIVMLFLVKLKMSEETLTLEKYLTLTLAIVGIVILNYDPSIKLESFSFTSIVLPVISASLLAISIVFTIKLSSKMKEENITSYPFLSNFYSKIISLITMIPFMVWYLNTDYSLTFTLMNSTLIVVYGVLVLTIGTIYYYKGVALTTKSLSIHIISYISAILSILWLWLLGLGTITPQMLIGSAFILTSNVLLHFNVDKSNAYNGSILWTLLVGTFIFFYDAIIHNDYYDAIAVPLLFFVIILAFLMDRIFKRTDDEEELMITIINNSVIKNKEALSKTLIELNTTRKTNKIIDLYNKIKNMDICNENKILIDKFILSKLQGIKFSELIVLFLTALIALYIMIFYKPDNAFNDIFKLCLSTAIVFNLFYVYDNEKERSKNFISIYKENGILKSEINTNMNTDETITEKSIAIALLICILFIFYIIYSLN